MGRGGSPLLDRRTPKALPRDLQRWVGQADPQDMTQMVELVERYVATEGYLGEGASPQRPGKAQRLQENPGKTVPFLKGVVSQSNRDRNSGMATGLNSGAKPRVVPSQRQETSDRERRGVQCFRCWEFGHVAANCPLTTEPMDCSWGRRKSLYAHPACLASQQEETGKQFCLVGIKGQQVSALLDSGSLVTLVRASLLDITDSLNSRVGVMCIHGDTKEYPTAVVMIETQSGNVKYQVGVVKNLMHAVILGRDFPLFWRLWGRGSNTEKGSPREAEEPDLSPEPFTSGDSAGEVGVTPDISSPLEVFAGLEDEVQEGDVVPDLEVSQDNFGTAQMRDPTLCKAREGIKEINGEPQFPGAVTVFPHMVLNQDLLYQVSKIRGEIIEQLVVPQQYRRVVLDMAHRHVVGGHLGVDKTAERVFQRFFWPGVAGDVKRYCNSCLDCQINAPKPHYRGLLVPLPIIEVPFERVAMDLVDPLPKSARGHQHILVILDYATLYPEAVPLRNTSSKCIAKELVHLFSRVGIPKEILTDQGTPFMSKVTKELCRLLGIKHLRTSVYHPQTDGLVERFNKTLKAMLKKAVDKDGKNWDCLLPFLLFSIREVPQASTGFSPFELLYGRHPRGLLDIAKETWEQEATPYKTVVEHIAQMQERISAVLPIVREHMAQEAQSRVYNRSATVRNFNPGDRVLVLVPTVESKFLAKWQGPYEIVEKVGEVNYKVRQPDKRKQIQLYHVNLLKPWRQQEVLASEPVPLPHGDNLVPEVKIAETLSVSQKQEVKEFLMRNRDVFSDLPG
uniref:Gypsy retrotransposon integrase-like protein 1 n=1 Tax=Xenopus tropicalis TaxID=8364 RepID=A0A803JMY6_XENTR